MKLIEIQAPPSRLLRDYILFGGVTTKQITSVAQTLLQHFPQFKFSGEMYRFIAMPNPENFDISTLPTSSVYSFSGSLDGLAVAMRNLSSSRGTTGVVITQHSSGFDVSEAIDHFVDDWNLDEDESDELSDYYEEHEILAPYDHPTIYRILKS